MTRVVETFGNGPVIYFWLVYIYFVDKISHVFLYFNSQSAKLKHYKQSLPNTVVGNKKYYICIQVKRYVSEHSI